MKTVVGDLLALKEGVILHQVNCLGVVGGLAGALHRKWPIAFADYLVICDTTAARNLGTYLLGQVNSRLWICHVFGQVNLGANTNLEAVDAALKCLAATKRPVEVYAPFKMGCGLGGGDWSQYLPILTRHFPDIIIVKREQDQ